MRLLVTGAGGMLGSAFVREARARGIEVLGVDREAMDVTDPSAVEQVVERWAGPGRAAVEVGVDGTAGGGRHGTTDWVVHCAAYTAVDRAESDPDLAHDVNVEGTKNVARAAASVRAGTVYISTDYVFDGEARAPYPPDAPTGPLSVYGQTKLEGEAAARRAYTGAPACADSRPLIVRTGWLYGERGRGFVQSILERGARGDRLRVVDDQVGGPTSVGTVVCAVLDLLDGAGDSPPPEVVHVADAGEASWRGLATEAFRILGADQKIEGGTSIEFGASAVRPLYSVLDVSETEQLLGRAMRPWRAVLREVLETEALNRQGEIHQ